MMLPELLNGLVRRGRRIGCRACLPLLMLAGLLLSACSGAPEPPMRLATNDWPGYRPLYAAREYGFFSKQDAHLIEMGSTSEAMRLFRNGSLDAVAVTLDEALLLAEDGLDNQVVLAMDVSAGGDALVAQGVYPDIWSLSGKRIGVEKTALGAYVMHRVLALNELSPDAVEAVTLEAFELEAAFLNNEVQAVVTFEPTLSRLKMAGGRVVFDSREIPGEIVDVLVVSRGYLREHPDKVQKIIAAWFQALARQVRAPEEVAALLADAQLVDRGDYLASLAGLMFPDVGANRDLLAQGGQVERNLRTLTDVMLGAGLLEAEPSLQRLVSDAFLPRDEGE